MLVRGLTRGEGWIRHPWAPDKHGWIHRVCLQVLMRGCECCRFHGGRLQPAAVGALPAGPC